MSERIVAERLLGKEVTQLCVRRCQESTLSLDYWFGVAYGWLQAGMDRCEVFEIISQAEVFSWGTNAGLVLGSIETLGEKPYVISEIKKRITTGLPAFKKAESGFETALAKEIGERSGRI